MFKRFILRKTEFFDHFESHATYILEAAETLLICVANETALNSYDEVKKLEQDAHAVVRQCIEDLHKTFITPIDRDQIHKLISYLDDIIDSIHDIFDCFLIYKIRVATADFLRLIEILINAVRNILIGVKSLRSAKNVEIHQACAEIYRFEHEADDTLRIALGRLFDDENDPKQIIKWKDLYALIKIAIDQCSDVADVLEGILLESD